MGDFLLSVSICHWFLLNFCIDRSVDFPYTAHVEVLTGRTIFTINSAESTQQCQCSNLTERQGEQKKKGGEEEAIEKYKEKCTHIPPKKEPARKEG